MHTRQFVKAVSLPHATLALLAWLGLHGIDASAALPANAPQVLLAITNSESMDGTTSGAIMLGSGRLTGALGDLGNSSSPSSYVVPTGFVAPVTNTAAGGTALWTTYCSGTSGSLCDNGPSRMNMTKAAISQVISTYASSINFAIYDYSTSGVNLYTTWVYQMSPAGSGFTFTNTASTAIPSTTVPNPCYGYTSFTNKTSSSVYASCAAFVSRGLFSSATLNGNIYMNVSASSDDPQVNDVLYAGSLDGLFLDYGGATPPNPYPHPTPTSPPADGSYPLSTYNNSGASGYSETYASLVSANNSGARTTTPTNAGFVPFSQQTMYIQRGFGYGASQDYSTGHTEIDFTVDPTTTAGAAAYAAKLAPETNNRSSTEIKSVAGQSGIAGLMRGADGKLTSMSPRACQQYVVLMTDGLPTLDASGHTWPPLGTKTANAYALTASYDPVTNAFVSSNSTAVTDAIAAITKLRTDGIKTYVIGLGAGVDSTINPMAYNLLRAMAIAGGTARFFPANDATSLSSAFSTIVGEIYAASSLAAPLVPMSISDGSSYEYVATTTALGGTAGHLTAYPVDATGTPTTGTPWSTDTRMTLADRGSKLYGGSALTPLGSLTAADFGLASPAPKCLSDTTVTLTPAVITAYTVNPAYVAGSCNFLGTRSSSSLVGAFSSQDSAHFFGPPSSGLLIARYPTYLTWARTLSHRPAAVLFTSSDGFLYSINASTGALNWGWINSYNLKQLQNYTSFQAQGSTNGDLSVVDAQDSGGNWASYIVGSMNSGANRFSLKLDATGAPASVVYDTMLTGTSAGDASVPTGTGPLRQPPIVAYIGGSAYTVYVVTSGSTSTLYETNVATGATSSKTLSFKVTSALFLDTGTNQLWMGDSTGKIWALSISGTDATGDVSRIQQTGQTVDPTTSAAVPNVQWVTYFKVNGIPYFYAANASQITLFGAGSTGWVPLWTATTSVNYTYAPPVPPATTGTWTQVVSSPNLLTSASVLSDMPIVIGRVLLVPVYVPGAGCGALGSGYYDFFNIGDGSFPTQALIDAGLSSITADYRVGDGAAFTPTVSMTPTGYKINNGSANCTTLCGGPPGTNKIGNSGLSWRQH